MGEFKESSSSQIGSEPMTARLGLSRKVISLLDNPLAFFLSTRPFSALISAMLSSAVVFIRNGFSLRGVLAGLAMYCLTGFGFQINDLIDYRKDRAAGVQRPVATGILSRRTAFVFACILLLITFALSAWAGAGVKVLAVTALALIFYTPAARKAPLFKGLYVAGLCMAPLYYGSVVSGVQYSWSPYALLAVFIIGREALMNSSEMHGDRGAGMVTVAVALGATRAKWSGILAMAFSLAALAVIAGSGPSRIWAAIALILLLCIFIWPHLDDMKRIELSRIPMLAAALAIAYS
jgi:4-hydroxybenzoate polyprenyltransferase